METKIKKLEGNQNKILEGKQNLKKKKCKIEIRHPWAIVLLFFEKMLAESLYKMIFIRCLFSKVFMKVLLAILCQTQPFASAFSSCFEIFCTIYRKHIHIYGVIFLVESAPRHPFVLKIMTPSLRYFLFYQSQKNVP